MPTLKLLFIGDIVGENGVNVVTNLLPNMRQQQGIHFCIANGENTHEGRGINEHIVKKLYKAGVDVITGGDHSFDKHLIFPYMARDNRLLRPANYPKGVPGFGNGVYDCSLGVKIGVINLRGQAYFNNPIRCPFLTVDRILDEMTLAQIIFVDFHAEATAEKKAMGWYLDGRVSAICGSHTHVQTADEQVLNEGTGYLTDVGFTGPHESVIGMDIQTAINRFTLQIPQKYKVAEKNLRLNAVLFHIDVNYGRTIKIERLNIAAPDLPANDKPEQEINA